jgi:hypothetical protein
MQKSPVRFILFFLLFSIPGICNAFPGTVDEWQLNDLVQGPDGSLATTGRDPFIIFSLVEKPRCEAGIIHYVIEFLDGTTPIKPFSMELFWRSKYDFIGFTEKYKVYFVLSPPKAGNTIDFYVPLGRMIPYVNTLENDLYELRIDFPPGLPLKFKILNAETLPNGEVPPNSIAANSLYRLAPERFLQLETAIPLICEIFRDGFHRLLLDPFFLIVWTIIILSLLITIRSTSKKPGKSKNKLHQNIGYWCL